MLRNRESRGELTKLEQEKWVYHGKAKTFQPGKQLDIGTSDDLSKELVTGMLLTEIEGKRGVWFCRYIKNSVLDKLYNSTISLLKV